MSITRVRTDNVTATLQWDEARVIRETLEKVSAGMLPTMEAAAEEVAAEARREWYAPGTGVHRETGKSGDIQVVSTIDLDRGELRVSVGSTDDRVSERGKPIVVYIHRPSRLSLIKKQVTPEEYGRTPPALRANFHADKVDKDKGLGEGPFIWVSNPYAKDGRPLLPDLVRKPMKLKIQNLMPKLQAAIAARLQKGTG